MARSSYVYVVSGRSLACFTVKHELVTWLEAYLRRNEPLDELALFRVRDGGEGEPVALDVREVLFGSGG